MNATSGAAMSSASTHRVSRCLSRERSSQPHVRHLPTPVSSPELLQCTRDGTSNQGYWGTRVARKPYRRNRLWQPGMGQEELPQEESCSGALWCRRAACPPPHTARGYPGGPWYGAAVTQIRSLPPDTVDDGGRRTAPIKGTQLPQSPEDPSPSGCSLWWLVGVRALATTVGDGGPRIESL